MHYGRIVVVFFGFFYVKVNITIYVYINLYEGLCFY